MYKSILIYCVYFIESIHHQFVLTFISGNLLRSTIAYLYYVLQNIFLQSYQQQKAIVQSSPAISLKIPRPTFNFASTGRLEASEMIQFKTLCVHRAISFALNEFLYVLLRQYLSPFSQINCF